MKYLKRYNESNDTISKSDIEDFFAHTFDLAADFKIEEAYFDTEDIGNWAHNDFSSSLSGHYFNKPLI